MQTAFREIIVYISKPTPKHSLHMSRQHAWVLNWAVCRVDQSASENIWCLKKLKIEQRTLWSLKHYDAKVGKYVSSVKRTKERVMQQSGQHATVSLRVLEITEKLLFLINLLIIPFCFYLHFTQHPNISDVTTFSAIKWSQATACKHLHAVWWGSPSAPYQSASTALISYSWFPQTNHVIWCTHCSW